MKFVAVAIFFFLQIPIVSAQNNQIKLYIQQIAANKVYLIYLQKGYALVNNGLTTISDITGSHYKLDQHFFDHLLNVSAPVSGIPFSAGIKAIEREIEQQSSYILKLIENGEIFSTDEKSYISHVLSDLLNDCKDLNESLSMVLTKSVVKMSDDERIKRIKDIYEEMRDNAGFLRDFSCAIKIIALAKNKEMKDADTVEKIYNR